MLWQPGGISNMFLLERAIARASLHPHPPLHVLCFAAGTRLCLLAAATQSRRIPAVPNTEFQKLFELPECYRLNCVTLKFMVFNSPTPTFLQKVTAFGDTVFKEHQRPAAGSDKLLCTWALLHVHLLAAGFSYRPSALPTCGGPTIHPMMLSDTRTELDWHRTWHGAFSKPPGRSNVQPGLKTTEEIWILPKPNPSHVKMFYLPPPTATESDSKAKRNCRGCLVQPLTPQLRESLQIQALLHKSCLAVHSTQYHPGKSPSGKYSPNWSPPRFPVLEYDTKFAQLQKCNLDLSISREHQHFGPANIRASYSQLVVDSLENQPHGQQWPQGGIQVPILPSKAGRDEEWGHGPPGKPPIFLQLWGNTCQRVTVRGRASDDYIELIRFEVIWYCSTALAGTEIGATGKKGARRFGWLSEKDEREQSPQIQGSVQYRRQPPLNPKSKRLQTGMRGAFGTPQGTVARVHIGQVIMSIRTKLQNKEHVIEALCRAKFKFPGRQKIRISKKWGFTKFNADEFEDMVAEKWLIPDGCGVKYIPNHGPLDKWRALHS
ncbi:PREDICTED: uncharacterized protein LOC101368842 [Odobenus rosmarus divergens]|uniref:Uncharacterized protein LOC101368842 n=1 Tax=Odobenus rosmarus divergens TaxID=9708 RepID=A0A9B0LPD4_ODORO